ncbi:MAG: anaerobic sulfatase maturase, partial [Chloroflexi bacterium]|nr:anaerobic sulfatase maturase [Chloroflexota bacterium]
PASGDCNLHCTYCFYHDRPTDPYKEQRRRRMSSEVLDALIRQGMALEPRHATFGWQGGEPTLAGLDFFEQVVKLQQKYGHPGQAVSNGMQTNGLLLDRDWARFLREYRFLVGVSLDGPASYHDIYRTFPNGSPTHERVIQVLRMLRQYRVEFNILAVVNRVTADHGPEIYDYFVSQGFDFLQFIPCVEVDPATGELTDFSVEPERFGDFLCAVFDRWYNGGDPQTSVRDFDAILAVYLGQPAPLCCYQERCGSYVVVEYNGDLYPCDFLVRQDLYLGNLMRTTLEEVFQSEALQRFAEAKADPRPECQACRWLPLCHQGCPRFVHAIGRRQHYLCRAYQRFFAHAHGAFLALRDRLQQRTMLASPNSLKAESSPMPVTPPRPIGRNDPCPCGSGKKYKHCCGRRGG